MVNNRHSGGSIPSEIAPDIPDIVSYHSPSHTQQPNPMGRQISDAVHGYGQDVKQRRDSSDLDDDEIYDDNISIDIDNINDKPTNVPPLRITVGLQSHSAPSPVVAQRSSLLDDDDIYDDNICIDSNSITGKPDNPTQIPAEPNPLGLQSHSAPNAVVTQISPDLYDDDIYDDVSIDSSTVGANVHTLKTPAAPKHIDSHLQSVPSPVVTRNSDDVQGCRQEDAKLQCDNSDLSDDEIYDDNVCIDSNNIRPKSNNNVHTLPIPEPRHHLGLQSRLTQSQVSDDVHDYRQEDAKQQRDNSDLDDDDDDIYDDVVCIDSKNTCGSWQYYPISDFCRTPSFTFPVTFSA